VLDGKSKELPKIIKAYQLKDMLNVDETGHFYSLQPSKTMTCKDDSCHDGTKSKKRVTVLLGCNTDDTEQLAPLVTGKYNQPHCFRNVNKLPTKCTTNSSSWMTSTTFQEFLVQFDHHIGAKNTKILLFMDQCAACPRDTTALKSIKVILFSSILHKPFATTGCRDHTYFQMPVEKATHIEGSSSD
jgi:hypothetical protein